MQKTKFVLLKETVTFCGSHLQPGEVVELTVKSADALINEGKGCEAIPDEETKNALESLEGTVATSEENDEQTPSENENGESSLDSDEISISLDKKYKADELKDAAKAAGVEFPYDSKKGEVINAVIEAGKAEALLAE